MREESTSEYFGTGWRRVDAASTRVVDTHCHSFPPLGRSAGWDPQVHTRLVQYHMRDFRDIWRKADGARLDATLLDYPSDDIHEMPDLGFRLTEFGRAEFSRDGVDYYMQAYPPDLTTWDAPGERMVAEMDIAGVDMAVLQSDHVYGDLNEYYGRLTSEHPGRFAPLAQVREWEADRDEELERVDRAVREYGCKGVYFSVEPLAMAGYADRLQDDKFTGLWDLVRRLDVPVWWYLDARKRDRKTAFTERLDELTRWSDANPDIPSLITHGLVPAVIFHDLGVPDELSLSSSARTSTRSSKTPPSGRSTRTRRGRSSSGGCAARPGLRPSPGGRTCRSRPASGARTSRRWTTSPSTATFSRTKSGRWSWAGTRLGF